MSSSKTCYDIDPAGDVLCTYTGDGQKEPFLAVGFPLLRSVPFAPFPSDLD